MNRLPCDFFFKLLLPFKIWALKTSNQDIMKIVIARRGVE